LRSIGEIASIQQKRIISLEQTFSASKKRLNTHTFMDLMPFLYLSASIHPSIDSGRAYCLRDQQQHPPTIMIEKRGTGAACALGVLIYGRRMHPLPIIIICMYFVPGMDHAYAEPTDRPPLQPAAAIVCASTLDKNMGSRKWNTAAHTMTML
jgi:hypothetical protein